MASQDVNQAKLIGSQAYIAIVCSLSIGLCYGMTLSQYGITYEHSSLGVTVSLFYASLHVLRLSIKTLVRTYFA